ncbi:hypothetical protein G7054_g6325 [Neopestalotiopsis clavispora]|nr:hypothetical protein G7054_g6325 [Neopestalotiopsis clavispora]
MSQFRAANVGPTNVGSREPKAVSVVPIALGIDFGSTSTRAFLWCPETNEGYHVESTSRARKNQRFDRGDFSSVGYPFDDGEIYLGEKCDASRESISLKYAFYVLANAPAELASQYRLSRPLHLRQNEETFRGRLYEGIRKLFTAVQCRVAEVCQEEELRVTSIGLSIPSQWTLDFMDVYRGIIKDVFKHNPETIFFVTEVEALAHFLCIKKMNRLIPLHGPVHDAVVVMLDFGGHTMNTCTLKIVHDPDGLPAFYLIGDPEALQREYQIVPSPANKQKLLDSINLAKHELGPECDNKDLDCDLTDRNMTYSVSLDEESITRCFNEAMEMPLALAAARIRDAARVLKLDKPIGGFETAAKPRVILAGGTANHEGLESRIRELCHINGLDSPVNTRGIITQYNSAKIASGAAFAAGSYLCYDFVDLGRPTKGSWSFSLDLIGHGDQMKLIVHRSRQYGKAKPQVYKSVTVSLHYNREHNASLHAEEEVGECPQSAQTGRLDGEHVAHEVCGDDEYRL